MSGEIFQIIGAVLILGGALWTWWREHNSAKRQKKMSERQEQAVERLRKLWSESNNLDERQEKAGERQEQAVHHLDDGNTDIKKAFAKFEEIEAEWTAARNDRRKTMIIFVCVVVIAMAAWVATGGISGPMDAVALAGLPLTLLALLVAFQTEREVKDIKNKLDSVLTQLGQLRQQIRWLAIAFGAATLLVVALLWLSHCSRATVTPTGDADRIGYAGQPLPDPVEVLVQTNSGVPEGATVVFAPMRGHGTASPDATLADSAGRAQTVWTLGSKAGEQRMAARVLGGNSVWITAEATAREDPVPADIKITPDSAVLRFVGDIAPFTAEILDQHGDPFPGSVTWSNKRPCVFRAGSYGFAIAKETGVDSMVAAFDTIRASAPVRVEIGGR